MSFRCVVLGTKRTSPRVTLHANRVEGDRAAGRATHRGGEFLPSDAAKPSGVMEPRNDSRLHTSPVSRPFRGRRRPAAHPQRRDSEDADDATLVNVRRSSPELSGR
jgi:hypothetical protein